MRKPQGFQQWKVKAGVVQLRVHANGAWVILATPPDLKLDNVHHDRRPHMHVGGWESEDRRSLRDDLSPEEARDALIRQLNEKGYIDAHMLEEELS